MEEFFELIEIEEILIEALGNRGALDGHDFGRGEFNIFFLTDDPERLFEPLREIITCSKWRVKFKSGVRKVDGDDYRPIWPVELKKFCVK